METLRRVKVYRYSSTVVILRKMAIVNDDFIFWEPESCQELQRELSKPFVSTLLYGPFVGHQIKLPWKERQLDPGTSNEDEDNVHGTCLSNGEGMEISISMSQNSEGMVEPIFSERVESMAKDAFLLLKLHLHSSNLPQEELNTTCGKALMSLHALDVAHVAAACELLSLDCMPEPSLSALCLHSGFQHSSSRIAGWIATHALLPRALALEKPASRTLFQALVAVQHHHPLVLTQV